MAPLRSFVTRRRWLAAWLVGAALLMKLLVPAGFMPGMSGSMIVVQLCTGQGVQTVLMEIPGKSGDADKAGHEKSDMPCAFAGLSSLSLAAADPVLLAIAIAFIIAAAFGAAPTFMLPRGLYLRPPSQGPPVVA